MYIHTDRSQVFVSGWLEVFDIFCFDPKFDFDGEPPMAEAPEANGHRQAMDS